ncbi:MAG TPA: hypothetical protein VES20_11015, partial [Bryobacteraceae bacterium]|nr:hypothetical protein [Bryobacteraceae bacterium]
MTRRELLAGAGALPAVAQGTRTAAWLPAVLARHDKYVTDLMTRQITDPASRWRGIYLDDYGLPMPGVAGGIIDALTSAWLHPGSKYHKDAALPERIRLAADLLRREQTPDGNWHLPTTNFNSPPDTGFIVRAMSPAAVLLRRAGEKDLFGVLAPVLRKAGEGMVKGGVHTPNHRWVVSAALAQLYDLFKDERYVRRIDQWLAEGIDLDSDGQWTERSTYVYNPITDAAFVTMAAKLNRPQLLQPARRNLESMLYLLHPGYEVVTEISTRQDLNIRGDMGPYWFSLAYLSAKEKDGRFAALADHFAPMRASLSALMEYPDLASADVAAKPLPDTYTKLFPHNHLAHIRRGGMSAVVLGGGRDRVFSFRNGDAVVNAVRFASAFFGKGQFAGGDLIDKDRSYSLMQKLQGPYYQPLDPARTVDADSWSKVRAERGQTEVGTLVQTVTVSPLP